jgi:hypothetical protein
MRPFTVFFGGRGGVSTTAFWPAFTELFSPSSRTYSSCDKPSTLCTAVSGGGGRNGEADFHGEKRTDDTHASKTDLQAKLFHKGKGKEAKLRIWGNC